jgi:integrase/recombinase XerD
MLTIYRRHRKACKHRDKGREHRHCQCPIWVDGFLGGKELRESLKLRDWQRAQETVREWEANDRRDVKPERKRLEDAWADCRADMQARKLHIETIRKYKTLESQMVDFAARHGLRFLDEFTLADVSKFRSEWSDGQRSSGKKLERLRTFFSFGQKRKWIPENPASDLKAPKITLCPTLPFTHNEMLRILSAINKYENEFSGRGSENARRMQALVVLLRYGGMRIGDTVSLSANRIEENRLLLYTQKTGVPVNNVLPDFVLKALEATPKVAGDFYFWDGESKLETIIGSWRKRLNKLFELAEIRNGHPHRFRDTFAVELLLTGVPIERVSILLGHESVRTTERNYAPWVRSRQEQLEADLTRAWGLDPVIAAQTSQARGTRQVHEKKRSSNSQILKREIWRRGWDSNPRMEVLQTSPLGHLGTAPNF